MLIDTTDGILKLFPASKVGLILVHGAIRSNLKAQPRQSNVKAFPPILSCTSGTELTKKLTSASHLGPLQALARQPWRRLNSVFLRRRRRKPGTFFPYRCRRASTRTQTARRSIRSSRWLIN